MARPKVKTHGMRDARATSPVSSGPEPHDPPAILVEWSGPGTVPVSDLHSVARARSGPVAGHGARAPHGVVIVRWRGRGAQRVDSGSHTPSQGACTRAERTLPAARRCECRHRSRPRRAQRRNSTLSAPAEARRPSEGRRTTTTPCEARPSCPATASIPTTRRTAGSDGKATGEDAPHVRRPRDQPCQLRTRTA